METVIACEIDFLIELRGSILTSSPGLKTGFEIGGGVGTVCFSRCAKISSLRTRLFGPVPVISLISRLLFLASARATGVARAFFRSGSTTVSFASLLSSIIAEETSISPITDAPFSSWAGSSKGFSCGELPSSITTTVSPT